MDTTTKKATLPASKKEIEYTSEITAGVWIDLQAVKFAERSEFLIKTLLTKYDGKAENIPERIKAELRAGDYMFIEQIVLTAVNEENDIATGKTGKKKLNG